MDVDNVAASPPVLKQLPVRGSFYPRKSDFNEYWPRIEEILRKVMTTQPCSSLEWDNSFFDIYALCTSSNSNTVQLYASLTKFYMDFVKNTAEKLAVLESLDLIEAYSAYWKNFNAGVYRIHELFGYLNKSMRREFVWRLFCRDYEDLSSEIGENSLHVLALSRVIWQKFLLLPLQGKLYNVIWDEFSKFRNTNYTIGPPMCIRYSLDSFIEVCFPSDQERATLMHSIESGTYMQNRTPSPERLQFYEDFFERRFLEDTENFFKHCAVVHDQSQSMYDKMAASASILASEERFCKMVLFLPTVEKTLKLLRVLFVLGPMEKFKNVLPEYVRNEKKSELNLAFRLLSPFKEQGLSYLIQEYETHVARTLTEQLEATNLTPASFVEIVCNRHNYFMQLSNEVFEGSQDLNDGYRRAVESVVNSIKKQEPFYAAKMIARHMDLLLKRSSRNKGDDFEDRMNDAITVFRFIKDKDAFLKIYQRLFSTRLLSKLFYSLPMESLMIDKLKTACGNDYTNKLVRMYTDYENSRQLTEDFQQNQCTCSHHKEDEITVIQTCAWPVTSSREDQNLATFKVPAPLASLTQCFKQFYEAKHNGRVLNYAYHVSSADIGVNVGSRSSTVTMTVPQAVILLAYNSADQLTIGKLAEDSGLSFEYVCSCLRALLDFKILKTETSNRDFYTPETEVHINVEFNAARTRIHLQPPAVVSRTQEQTNIVPTQHETTQDRKSVVECVIVRAMKTRKLLKHQQLVEFILNVTKSRFVPSNQLIKLCIESLIEKHFIHRTGVDSYEYLA